VVLFVGPVKRPFWPTDSLCLGTPVHLFVRVHIRTGRAEGAAVRAWGTFQASRERDSCEVGLLDRTVQTHGMRGALAALVRTIRAVQMHAQACTCRHWSPCGSHVFPIL
jgi:hypothetical protein